MRSGLTSPATANSKRIAGSEKIEERIQHLALHNGAGHPRPELAPALRCSNLKDHVVFYRPLGTTGIEVVRVLHSSRDIQADFF
ncbi:MAG: hypothetical protein RIS79_1406 [Verrucomicrobiota bacterium]|jgi:plasmid stabilization system protein ParE